MPFRLSKVALYDPFLFLQSYPSTGLDAAGPGFENTEPGCRLDQNDAKFVDVIRTSSDSLLKGGAGIEQKVLIRYAHAHVVSTDVGEITCLISKCQIIQI